MLNFKSIQYADTYICIVQIYIYIVYYIYNIYRYMYTKLLEPICPLIWNFRAPTGGPDGCILKVRKASVTPNKWVHMFQKYVS